MPNNAAVKVKSLHIYPVKSCHGIDVREFALNERGPEHDRHWMVTDLTGKFLTQRQLAKMALIRPNLESGGLRLAAPGHADLLVPYRDPADRREVQVWDARCEGLDEGDEAAKWLTSFLGTDCRLVHMAPDFRRAINGKYGVEGATTGFADSLPVQLIAQASLDFLNAKLESPLPMDRFRPNIVVEGCAPHAEDSWRRIEIGGIPFHFGKPCVRCVITTIDQETAAAGKEPLKTLATYRRQENKVLFGQLLIHLAQGRVRVGDTVKIIETKG